MELFSCSCKVVILLCKQLINVSYSIDYCNDIKSSTEDEDLLEYKHSLKFIILEFIFYCLNIGLIYQNLTFQNNILKELYLQDLNLY